MCNALYPIMLVNYLVGVGGCSCANDTVYTIYAAVVVTYDERSRYENNRKLEPASHITFIVFIDVNVHCGTGTL